MSGGPWQRFGAVVRVGQRPALAPDGRLAMGLALLGYPMFFLLFDLRPDAGVWNMVTPMFVQLSMVQTAADEPAATVRGSAKFSAKDRLLL